jgi:hypothetical protein
MPDKANTAAGGHSAIHDGATVHPSEQQAVPVAQEDREAGLSMYLFTRSIRPGDRHYETACVSFRSGARDEKEAVQAFARHRLASVSSASAEGWKLVPVEMTDEMASAAAVELMAQSDGLGWEPTAIYRAMLAASPEPVPATNQAGEVERLRAALEAWRDAQQATDDAVEHMECALAEGWYNEPGGTGHVGDSDRRADAAWAKAIALRDTALARAEVKP